MSIDQEPMSTTQKAWVVIGVFAYLMTWGGLMVRNYSAEATKREYIRAGYVEVDLTTSETKIKHHGKVWRKP